MEYIMNRLPIFIVLLIASLAVQTVDGELLAQDRQQHSWLVSNNQIKDNPSRITDLVSLADLLSELEKRFNVTFLYDHEIVANKFLNRQEASLGNDPGLDLSLILLELGLSYDKIQENMFILLPGPSLLNRAYSFQSVSGTVTDAGTGETLPGVNIVVKGTTTGTSTDSQGAYDLNVPSLQDTLVFSFIGYQTREVPINDRTEIDVALQAQAVVGEDIVVVGYGTQRSQDVTGSLGTVSMSNLEDVPMASPDEMLMGQLPGVVVSQSSGMPGSAPQIQIRGIGAVGAGSQPLYVIDGFALPQPLNEADARLRNPLADIPQQDIESITVLKDASATAIYGSRASNGVVLVTTKSGSVRDQPEINISTSTGYSNRLGSMLPDMANARQYAEFQRVIWEGRVETGQASEVPEIFQNPESLGEGVDWPEVITEGALTQRIDVSLSGGNENLRTFFSAGYLDQEGILPGVDFKRVSFRANIDGDISDKFKVGLRLAPTYTIRNQPDTRGEGRGSPLGRALMLNPIQPAFDENGEVIPYPSEAGPEVPGTWTHANPLFMLDNIKDETTDFRTLLNTYVSYEISDGLVANSSFNVDYGQSRRDFFNPSTVGGTNNPPPTTPVGSLSAGYRLNWLSETTLNLENTQVGPGNLSALAGFTLQEQADEINATFSGIFPDDNVKTLNVASDITGNSAEQYWSLVSFLSRVNYNLLDRYVITGTIRTDGSSRFGADNRWGVFPSAALAWIVSNETFYKDGIQNFMPEFKVRLSYGKSGNNQIGNFSAISVLSRADALFGNDVEGGRVLSTLGNRELGWEKTEEWNLGLDASFFNYRFNLSIDAYNRITTDLLLNRNLPTLSGFSSVVENSGSMRNRGIEFSINAVPVERSNIVWTTDFNFSLNRNKVTSLPTDRIFGFIRGTNQPSHITQEGRPIGQHYGLIVEGIFQNQEEIDNNPSVPGTVPGNHRFRDVNGDGTITREDMTVIGNPHPDFTFAMTNSVNMGNFDVRVNFTGQIGGEIRPSGFYQNAMNIDGLFNVSRMYAENFWRSEDEPGCCLMPSPLGPAQARQFFRQQHSVAIESTSNLWLRNATIRYNLPQGIAGTRGASIYITGQNLFVITPYFGNPDAAKNTGSGPHFGSLVPGSDNLPFPIARTFTLGIDLRF